MHDGFTVHLSSGPLEGNIHRLKLNKRQMYGRGGFDLLRKRVLLAGLSCSHLCGDVSEHISAFNPGANRG